MDPYSQQSQDLTNVPSNYLDTIAPQAPQPMIKPWLLWAIIGGVILLMIIIFMAMMSGGQSSTERFQQMLWRTQSVNSLASDSYKSIKSSDLRAANSNLTTILSSAEQEGLSLLPKDKQKQKPPKNSKMTAYFADLQTTLEDARLNGDFDARYAREMAYQIGLLRSELKYLHGGAKSELKAYLEKLDSSLETVSNEFTEFGVSSTTES